MIIYLVPFVCIFALTFLFPDVGAAADHAREGSIAPKVLIISMWTPEAQVWHAKFPSSGIGNLTSVMVTTPGLSMLYPYVFCTEDKSVCQLTVGEGEINAAASMMALVLSSKFDFRRTYFIFAGIAGVNPRHATLGSVAIAKYSVQVGLQYEIDSREIPPEWPSGYVPYGRAHPYDYPLISYGTEVFELNVDLRDRAYDLAKRAPLADSKGARLYRARYAPRGDEFQMGIQPPSVVKCDSATSDVYFSGSRLAEAFEKTTEIWTNGSAVYCMSAQEENATLEVMVRAAIDGLVDFARIIVMRSASNFDRAPPDSSEWEHLTVSDQNAFYISLDNLFNVGIVIIGDILHDWNCTYFSGITPSNYVGDIFGSLGGQPDFGFGSITGGERIESLGGSGDIIAARGSKARVNFGKRWL